MLSFRTVYVVTISMFFLYVLGCSDSSFTGNGIPQGDSEGQGAGGLSGVQIENLVDATIPLDQSAYTVQACFSYDRTKLPRHRCDRAEFDIYFFEEKVGQINLNNRALNGASVEGGKIDGRWDSEGTFMLTEKCALERCHDEVTFVSLIGEVVDSLGRTQWLKIEQGQILPDRKYTYNFRDFKLSDSEIVFGPLCSVESK